MAAIWLFGITDKPDQPYGREPLVAQSAADGRVGVVTTIPLLCFTGAATRLRLSTLGFFQYIGPTLMFLLAVTPYGEVPGKDKNGDLRLYLGQCWRYLSSMRWDTQRRLRRGCWPCISQ
ncbi:hypothetical protein MJK72_01610 [Klebsiella pneumoniae]|nr:hypothetical protein MJK72_01610 [Klebsiella pneumoniae]